MASSFDEATAEVQRLMRQQVCQVFPYDRMWFEATVALIGDYQLKHLLSQLVLNRIKSLLLRIGSNQIILCFDLNSNTIKLQLQTYA